MPEPEEHMIAKIASYFILECVLANTNTEENNNVDVDQLSLLISI